MKGMQKKPPPSLNMEEGFHTEYEGLCGKPPPCSVIVFPVWQRWLLLTSLSNHYLWPKYELASSKECPLSLKCKWAADSVMRSWLCVCAVAVWSLHCTNLYILHCHGKHNHVTLCFFGCFYKKRFKKQQQQQYSCLRQTYNQKTMSLLNERRNKKPQGS